MNSQDGRDYGYKNLESETANEIKQRIRMVRQLVEAEVVNEESIAPKPAANETETRNRRQSVDTGSFLSFTFGFILFLLLAVGIYAFKNLYHAIIKRFYGHQQTQ